MSADAALDSRRQNDVAVAVYDTDLGITWLANANLAASNTFGVAGIASGGSMTWTTAQSWIAAMNAANYLGFNDWRLPAALKPDPSCSIQSGGNSYGVNCTGSEMGHLFYLELGGTAGDSVLSSGDSDLALFKNIQNTVYWSGTEYDASRVFDFNLSDGQQNVRFKSNSVLAWAVRTGDVAAVPLPAAAWLLGSGLVGLYGFARKKRTKQIG